MLPLFDSQPSPKLTDIVLNALADGAVVVTANARAARSLILHYAEQQRAKGLGMWTAPSILDWDTWLGRLWQEHSFSQFDSPLLLTQLQEHTLWVSAQQKDAHLVVWPEGLASLAQSAYQLLSEYKLHKEQKTVWFETDAEHFRQWAQAFEQICQDRNWASRSNLETLLSPVVRAGSLILPKHLLLVGFDRFTPAQQALLQHMREAGVYVEEAVSTSDAPPPILVAAADARDELLLCAQWCRHMLNKTPAPRIGVIAPDVSSIRAEADRIFRAVLMPQSLAFTSESAPMPFEFSLGVPLATVPVVRAALLMLQWLDRPLLEEDISWLSMSGFFHDGSSEILDLAQLDFKRRDSGALSPEISLKTLTSRYVSYPFFRRMRRVLRTVEEGPALTSNQTYTQWSERIQQWLLLGEWPGFRTPDSVQFQAQRRWLRLLDEISLLDFAGRKVPFAVFLKTLERYANETIFTSESHYAPIQILGAFESSGQSFDAVWFLGVDDTQWPTVGRPHPFLPVTLQRRARMPHCDAMIDTELAAIVTQRIAESAPECIFSYARQNKEGELRPSPILATVFRDIAPAVSSDEFRQNIDAPEPAKSHTQIDIAIAPSQVAPWPVDRAAGGADVLRDQAACPFRAFAKHRLAAKPLNRTEWGLDAAQRGDLLHKVLEKVWSPDTPEPFRMVSLDDIKSVISTNRLHEVLRYQIGAAFDKLVQEHADDPWMQAYLESEQQRLLVRLREWLLYEARRHPFTVEKREERLQDVNVGALKLNLRADRIDQLPDHSHALIDYKTGEVSASAWKGDRPDEPQLPLYAVYGNVDDISGLLFAQIRAGKTGFVGRAADAQQNLIADLTAASALVNQPYDEAMHDAWQHALLQLAEEFLHGEASVDPKHSTDTCKYCPLPGLCRISESDLANEPDDESPDA